jgi:hypothetical protein
VLIVTPAIFLWLREREVRRAEQAVTQEAAADKVEATTNETIDHNGRVLTNPLKPEPKQT